MKAMYITLAILAAIALIVFLVLQHPAFGALPRGERLQRVLHSPNFRDGEFRNLQTTATIVLHNDNKGNNAEQQTDKPKNIKPTQLIEAVRTDLTLIDRSVDQVIWFGHSSYLMFVGGKTILVDPILTTSFPTSLVMRPFRGTAIYSPNDMPDIDYLVITHDHWDHLDYKTLRQLRTRISHVVCPLGVGAHLERWGFGDRLIELDWYDDANCSDIYFTCLPSRHFSGRLLKRNQSLWASFMIQCNDRTIFVGGDGGYGSHFEDIAHRFPTIDLAMLENGQYNTAWPHIHTLPHQLPLIIHTLNAHLSVPIHNGKYALARHPWNEPTNLISIAAHTDTTLHIALPKIGQPILLE